MYCEKLAAQGYLGTFTDFMSEDFPEQARTHAAGMRTSRAATQPSSRQSTQFTVLLMLLETAIIPY